MKNIWPWYIIADNSGDVPLAQREKVIKFLNDLLVELTKLNQKRTSEGDEVRVAVMSAGEGISWISPREKMIYPDSLSLSPLQFRGGINHSAIVSALEETASARFFSPELRLDGIYLPQIMYIGAEPKDTFVRRLACYTVVNGWIRNADKIAVCFRRETGSRLDELCQVLYADESALDTGGPTISPIDLVFPSFMNRTPVRPVFADNADTEKDRHEACIEADGNVNWYIERYSGYPY